VERVEWEPLPGKIIAKVIGESEFLVNRNGVQLFSAPGAVYPRTTARVIAVYDPYTPDGESSLEPIVKVDDIVIFGRHSGIEIQYGREKVIILKEVEILTKIKVLDDTPIEEVGVARGAHDDVE
jgi:co-chaperonin GroES (HSP10)